MSEEFYVALMTRGHHDGRNEGEETIAWRQRQAWLTTTFLSVGIVLTGREQGNNRQRILKK